MPFRIIESFDIKRLDILDGNGVCDESVMPQLSRDNVLGLYEVMVLTRAFDEKALSLQRQGRIGTYASIRGQEAVDCASAFALSHDDWMFPTYRQNGAYITRGFPMEKLLQWSWDERGMQIPEGEHDFTLAIPIATQVTHAVGAAWALKLQKKKNAVLAFVGDGGTSEGDFNASMNFAGVYRTPCVILCENNQYAISLPVHKQTAAKTMAQKAVAYGFDGIQVDGNDAFAVFKAVKDAVEKARQGGGPTFIEAVTYRMGDHTTSDDASLYRSGKEVKEWEAKDPVSRLRAYVRRKRILSPKEDEEIMSRCHGRVQEAVDAYERIPPPDLLDMFRYTFERMTPQLQEQYEYLQRVETERGRMENKQN